MTCKNEEIVPVQVNIQHKNVPANIIDVSKESTESLYNNRNEIAMDNGTSKINNDEKECDDVRKEGKQPLFLSGMILILVKYILID